MANERHLLPPDAAERDIRSIERAIAALAGRQKGAVERAQLLDAGLSRHEITRRMGRTLQPVFRGVYAVGHVSLSREGHFKAALLAAGEGAVLSHHAAAEVHELRAPKRGDV